MADIIISRNIVQNIIPHNRVAQIPSGGSRLLEHQNGDQIYETSEANKVHWNSLNKSSQEILFRRYFQEHIDLEELIEEDKRKKEV